MFQVTQTAQGQFLVYDGEWDAGKPTLITTDQGLADRVCKALNAEQTGAPPNWQGDPVIAQLKLLNVTMSLIAASTKKIADSHDVVGVKLEPGTQTERK